MRVIHLKRGSPEGEALLPLEQSSQLRRPQLRHLQSAASQLRKALPRPSCRNPGSNQGPLDLQSNALPTELFRLACLWSHFSGPQPSSLPFLHKVVSLPERGKTQGSKAPPLPRHRHKGGPVTRCQRMAFSKQIPSAFWTEDEMGKIFAEVEGQRSMPRWRSRQRVSLII